MEQLTPEQFDNTARAMSRAKPETIEALRKIFVDGMQPMAVATALGMKSKGEIYRKMQFFIKKYQELAGLPPGWIRFEIAMPLQRAKEIIAESQILREDHDRNLFK